jgi:hypothetical protein
MIDVGKVVGECLGTWLSMQHGVYSEIRWEHLGENKRLLFEFNKTLSSFSPDSDMVGEPLLKVTITLSPRLLLPGDIMSMSDVMKTITDTVQKVKGDAAET